MPPGMFMFVGPDGIPMAMAGGPFGGSGRGPSFSGGGRRGGARGRREASDSWETDSGDDVDADGMLGGGR